VAPTERRKSNSAGSLVSTIVPTIITTTNATTPASSGIHHERAPARMRARDHSSAPTHSTSCAATPIAMTTGTAGPGVKVVGTASLPSIAAESFADSSALVGIVIIENEL
jgi:hypothetical protein